VYIGQTIQSLQKRKTQHFCKSSNSNKHLRNAINKHGKENFVIEIIETCSTLEQLDQREQYWIKFYDSTNPQKGYNSDPGGRKNIPRNKTFRKINTKKGRPKVGVEQLEPGTFKLLNIYNSISEAAQATQILPCSIARNCQLKIAYAKGFIWKYTNIEFVSWKQLYDKFLEDRAKNRYKKERCNKKNKKKYQYIMPAKINTQPSIIKKTLQGDIIEVLTYKQFMKLPKKLRQAVGACLNGRSLTSYGYKWERDYTINI
jgi:group I intron endonuclease